MKRKNLFYLILCVIFVSLGYPITGHTWSNDRYLKGFQETTVDMGKDYSGNVVSTVVRKLDSCNNERAILYVHGYNDYFFQEEMANCFVDSCWNFYAVDLRKYGRSIQKEQTPYQMRNISEYFPDIDSAIALMSENNIKEVIIMGHSTGGLVVASYMNANPSSLIKGVILNSPFLDWNMSKFFEKVAIPVVSGLGKIFPNMSFSQGNSSAYAESLLADYHGEWNFDTNLKTVKPRKVTAGWIRGITQAQKKLRKMSDITVPILLMYSDKSISRNEWTPEHQTGDAVLDVKDIKNYGEKLGPDVTEDCIENGMHDLMLSAPDVRKQVLRDVFHWIQENHL